jgi:hypothetical protein
MGTVHTVSDRPPARWPRHYDPHEPGESVDDRLHHGRLEIPGKKDSSHRVGSVLKEREEHAEEMAKTPTVTVTLRIPAAFNEWLDADRHLSYPLRETGTGRRRNEVRLHAAG